MSASREAGVWLRRCGRGGFWDGPGSAALTFVPSTRPSLGARRPPRAVRGLSFKGGKAP